jgi:hypothetical protein
MERDETVVPGGAWALPGQREAGAEPVAGEPAAVETEVIAAGPVANPNRLRLGLPSSI